MKAALSLMLVLALVTAALPVSAQEQAETPWSFDSRSPASPATADPRTGTAPSGEPSLCYGKADRAEQIPLFGRPDCDLFWVAGERPERLAAPSPKVAPSRDSILIGGLIGFSIGAVLGTTVGAEACLHEPRWHCAVKVGVPIGAIGALIGWLHK